jgi:hypothetical protein
MPRKPSRTVAVMASLALAACIEDFEFLCIVGVGGLIALIVVLATVKTGSVPQGAVTNSTP